MRESGKMVAGVAVCSVRYCSRRAACWKAVFSSLRVDGCEMVRRRRSFGGWKCSRGGRSGAGDCSMRRGDKHPRRGASCGRCSVVGE